MYTISLFLILLITLTAAQNIECYNASQCVGDELVGTTVKSSGYKSSSSNQSSIDSNSYVRCYGAFSCFDTSFIKASTYIYCNGGNSCGSSLINNIGSIDYIYCHASNSCSQSDLRTIGTGIYCYGDQSCAYTNINIEGTTTNIYGYGAYSMMYTNITTPNNNSLINMRFNGYMSAFAANITCSTTDICHVTCYNDACSALNMQCKGNCSITNESYSAILAINNIIDFNESAFELIYDSQSITTNADKQCNQQPNTIKYDNYYQNYQGADIISNGGPICCRGLSSCQEVNKIQLNDTNQVNQDAIVCSGYLGCYGVATIISNAPILCEGLASCRDTNITSSADIYCMGSSSCRFSNISKAKNIYCSGYQSCYGTSIESSGDINIYLLGYESGMNMILNCNVGDDCKTFCEGLDGCKGATVYTNWSNPTTSPTNIPSVLPTNNLLLVPKSGPCPNGYQPFTDDADNFCEPCLEFEAGTLGKCDRCGDGKQPNDDRTNCILCGEGLIGIDGYCDVDCSESNKIANELHTGCIEKAQSESWYETAEFDAIISIIGTLTGFSCIVAFIWAFCKKKACFGNNAETQNQVASTSQMAATQVVK